MSKDNLLVEVHPALVEAMGLTGDPSRLDYFDLLGLKADAPIIAADVDRGVMLRSKPLRQWQNSPHHGPEVVKLLPLLHRVGAILKDSARRQAYKEELDRHKTGRKVDPRVEFERMVRAAVADGQIDERSKAELRRYAAEAGLSEADSGSIIGSIIKDIPKPVPVADTWEFSVAEGGETSDAFTNQVQALMRSGQFNAESRRQMLARASAFGLAADSASMILRQLGQSHFRALVQQVAEGGVLSDNQARLLMPKAENLGVPTDAAFQILSDFTFTGASQADLATLNLTTPVFDQDEIEFMLEKQGAVIYRRRGAWVKKTVVAVCAVAIVGVVGFVLVEVVGTLGSGSVAGKKLAEAPVRAVPAAPVASPTPAGPWANPKPDPVDGLLAVASHDSGDPPPFRIKITEVTRKEYQAFLTDMFYPSIPEGWRIDYSFPAGSGDLPVTGVEWKDAKEYCAWRARKSKLPEGAVRLPRIQEFQRLMKAPLTGGLSPADPKSWAGAGLAALKEIGAAKSHPADTLFLGNGQVYDLLSNAAEWGEDDKDGKKAVLGGDAKVGGEGYNVSEIRHLPANTKSPTLGFRCVHQP